MRNCKYCGKEYPDEVTVCELDGSPLVDPNVATPSPVTKPEQSSAGTPPLLQPSHSPLSSKTENILGVIVGAIGVLILVVGTLSLANFGARTVNAGCLAIGLVMLILGIRMAQNKDRLYFFTMRSMSVFVFVVCNCFALYSLSKVEDWPYGSITTSVGTSNYYDISAYHYYFVWSQTERENENKMEASVKAVVVNLVDLNGNPIHAIGSDSKTSLSDKESFNITLAALIEAVSILMIMFYAWLIVSKRKEKLLQKNGEPTNA